MAELEIAVRDADGNLQPLGIRGGRQLVVDDVAAEQLAAILAELQEGLKVVIPLITGSTAGPASYPTGGFVVDVSAQLATVAFFMLAPLQVGPNLPPVHFEYSLNQPSNGRVRVKVMRHRYDRLQQINGITGQPAGVSIATTSGARTGQASPDTVDAGPGLAGADPTLPAHTHAFDVMYQHQHAVTHAQTNTESVELPNGTDLSAALFAWLAVA
jgi:hypothetical protein